MVFRSQPENGDRGNSALGKIARQAGGGNSFINGVSRPAEQPHLLAGYDGYGARLGEPTQAFGVPILRLERANQRRAAVIRIVDLPGGGYKRSRIVRIVPVEAGYSREVVTEIRKQPGRSRQFRVPDATGFHARVCL